MEKFLAIIYADRSYPEGADACVAQIYFVSHYEKEGKTYIVAESGETYSFTATCWYGNTVEGKDISKV